MAYCKITNCVTILNRVFTYFLHFKSLKIKVKLTYRYYIIILYYKLYLLW